MIKNEEAILIYKKGSGKYFPVYVNAYMMKEEIFVDGNIIGSLQEQVEINYKTWITEDGDHVYTVYNHKLGFSAN